MKIGTTNTGEAGTNASVTITGNNPYELNFTIPRGNTGASGTGSGDMSKIVYDTNDNGIVDNSEKVNGHTVLSDVPTNAIFTDTTYSAGTGISIDNGVINNTQTSANWGNITGTINNQTDLVNELDKKVDIVTGKGLSTNDYTTTEKTKLSGISEHANNYSLPTASSSVLGGIKIGSRLSISNGVLSANLQTDNNYTTSEKTKLASIASGAEVNVNADWNSTSGDSQILNKPTIPTVPTNVSAFTNDSGYLTTHQDISGKVDKITGKGLSTNDLTNTLKTNYDTAYANTHTHSNKSVLDAITSSYTTEEKTKLISIDNNATCEIIDLSSMEFTGGLG
jgi:hypothetical protein